MNEEKQKALAHFTVCKANNNLQQLLMFGLSGHRWNSDDSLCHTRSYGSTKSNLTQQPSQGNNAVGGELRYIRRKLLKKPWLCFSAPTS